MSPIVRASEVKGLSVFSPTNESLGKIEDLVIDTQTGQIRYAVLSFGGLLGIGNKLFAVPWQNLSFISKGTGNYGTLAEKYCVLDISKEALKAAPGFDKDHWPNFADMNLSRTIDRYYQANRPLTERPERR
jgi:sporulation protein YlmC with PRC-barrel domain